ncbi:hypothetical protein AAG906_038997 [Vitis piasezkii]
MIENPSKLGLSFVWWFGGASEILVPMDVAMVSSRLSLLSRSSKDESSSSIFGSQNGFTSFGTDKRVPCKSSKDDQQEMNADSARSSLKEVSKNKPSDDELEWSISYPIKIGQPKDPPNHLWSGNWNLSPFSWATPNCRLAKTYRDKKKPVKQGPPPSESIQCEIKDFLRTCSKLSRRVKSKTS